MSRPSLPGSRVGVVVSALLVIAVLAACSATYHHPTGQNVVENFLNGVAGLSSTDAWTVGSYQNGSGRSRTLIERWDGTQWSVVPSVDPGARIELGWA